MKYRGLLLTALAAALLSGCSGSRMAQGRGTGYGTLDLSIGVLPVSGSLNPDQNMYPGFARAMDEYGFFRSVEPVASAGGKRFDLLLMAEPPGFAPAIKVVSGYSSKTLYEAKVMALYGRGVGTAARNLAKFFAVGTPAYQQLIAEREVYRRSEPAPAAPPAVAAVEAPSSAVDAPSYKLADDPSKFAVVVGVESYVDLPEARFAERDAAAMRAHLRGLGYPERNVVLLTGERASRSALAKNIESWLPQVVKEGSTVFFYYSGHGAPDPATGTAYLVPRDGDPNFLPDTAYPVKRLYEKLGALKAKRVFVALDACFSGIGQRSVLAKGTRPLVAKVDLGGLPPRVAAIAAADGSEVSGTLEAEGHGLFTYYFLKGLNGAAAKAGAVTWPGLHEYVVPLVQDEARRSNRLQTPRLLGAGDGARLR